ncbi:armadillo-type protein [Circinella umbellata]|nr:armadillo-type protein [Circinella umbellata]
MRPPTQRSLPDTPNDSTRAATMTLCFLSGVAAAFMAYSMYSNLKIFHNRSHEHTSRKKREVQRQETNRAIEDSIPLKSLAYLTHSTNINIQNGAVKIILDRSMSDKYLPKLIESCKKENPIEIRMKGISALQLLTRRDSNREALLSTGALNVLVDALKCTDPKMKESVQRYAAVSICDLIQMTDLQKFYIIDIGILEPIKRILTSTSIRNNELKYWTLMILYQISRSDPFPKVLIEQGFVSVLAKMARMTYGNTNMPKFCIQSLVRIISNVDVLEAKTILTELLEYNVIDLISISLRSEDLELVYWAAGLMHEFVLKDVAAQQFREIKGIHTILNGLLGAEEIYISRVVLRTIKFMAYGQDNFRQEMVNSGMVKKIMRGLTLDDDDVRYWSILCIHAVAAQWESHPDIIISNEFGLMLELTTSRKIHVAIFASDILSLLCCIASNGQLLEPHANEVVSTLNNLLSYEELEVQYNAVSAIFNLTAMRVGNFACVAREQCLDTLISMCVSSTHERVQLTCAKALVLMAIRFRSITTRVTLQVIEPLINTCTGVSQHVLPIILMQSLITNSHGKSSSKRQHQQRSRRGNRRSKRRSRLIPDLEMSQLQQQQKSSSSEDSHNDGDEDDEDRTSLFMKFELPLSSRVQFVGALSTLRILLENEEVFGNVITGTLIESFIADIEKIGNALDDEESFLAMEQQQLKRQRQTSNRLTDMERRYLAESERAANIYNTTTTTSHPSSSSMVSESIREFSESLVLLAIYPVLEAWSKQTTKQITEMDENTAKAAYYEVLAWLKTSTTVSPIRRADAGMVIPASSSSSTVQSPSIPLSLSSSVSVATSTKTTSPRPLTYAPSDTSSDSEDDTEFSEDDDDDDQYIMSKKVESAAERLGETRRQDEEHNSATVEDMMAAGRPLHFTKLYQGFSGRALMVLRSLVHYGSVRQFLIHEIGFVEAMVYMFQNCRSLSDNVLTCLGTMICADPSYIIPESALQVMSISIWKSAQLPMLEKRSFHFYARLILTYATRCISSTNNKNTSPPLSSTFSSASSTASSVLSECGNDITFVEIDLHRRSKYCLLNYETRLEARNDSWTFETVRATHPTPVKGSNSWQQSGSHKYMYEVVLATDGLMQVGWVTEEFEIDPEGGTGVGDDPHSYGYDGYRVKKWHAANHTRRRTYGCSWSVGDTITCLLDLDNCEMRYYQNGQDLGVAFSDIDTDRVWYPAISLSTGQECRFRFGSPLDRLRYPAEGYLPFGELACSSISVELPPPQVIQKNNDDGDHCPQTVRLNKSDDIEYLTSAMKRMSVHTDDGDGSSHLIEKGNEEPSLRPARVQISHRHYHDNQRHFSRSSRFSLMRSTTILSNRSAERDDYSISPSLYFEMTIANRTTINKKRRQSLQEFEQRQQLDSNSNVNNTSEQEYTVGEDDEGRDESQGEDIDEDPEEEDTVIILGMQSLDNRSHVRLEYQCMNRMATLYQGRTARTEPFALEIANGDVVGLLYVQEAHSISITVNGKIITIISLIPLYEGGDAFRPYLPYRAGNIKTHINYGDELFRWEKANAISSKEKMAQYLGQLLL